MNISKRKIGTYLKNYFPNGKETYMERLIKEYISLLNEENLPLKSFGSLKSV